MRTFVDDVDQAVVAASSITTDDASRDSVVSVDVRVLLAEWAGPRIRIHREPKTVFCGQSEFARRDVEA